MSFFNRALHNRDVTLSEAFRHVCNQKRALRLYIWVNSLMSPSVCMYCQILNACHYFMKTEVFLGEMLLLTLQMSLILYSAISL